MKTLMLVRHAKSSWDQPGLADERRPLNKRGLRDAPEMGRRLMARGAVPEVIVSSPALRARTTAELLARELEVEETIVVDHRLYGTDAAGLLAIMREQDDGVDSVMVVGHDPEISDLSRRFSPLTPPMVTCAVLELHFDEQSWQDVSANTLVDKHFDSPKSEHAAEGAEGAEGAEPAETASAQPAPAQSETVSR